MTIFSAYNILKSQGRKKIKNMVDEGDNLEALMVLLPSFEYPDWDCNTVASFLSRNCGALVAAERTSSQRGMRQEKDQLMRDCGLVKVRGAVSGKIYWE